MKSHFLSLCACAVVATSASAYQFEGIGSYTDFDALNDSQLGLLGVYHLAPVDTNDVPLAEAGFLGRSSNVALGYTTFDKADADGLGTLGELYLQNLYFAAQLARESIGGQDATLFGIGAGYLPMPGLRLAVRYFDAGKLLDTTTLSLEAKYVAKLPMGLDFNSEIQLSQVDTGRDTVIAYDLSGDVFLNHALSAGLSYTDSDQANSDATIGLRGQMFFIPNLAGGLEYLMADNADRIVLTLTGRF